MFTDPILSMYLHVLLGGIIFITGLIILIYLLEIRKKSKLYSRERKY